MAGAIRSEARDYHALTAIARHRAGDVQVIISTGRDERIRTSDPHTPSVMRYQAALRPVTSGAGPIGCRSKTGKRVWEELVLRGHNASGSARLRGACNAARRAHLNGWGMPLA